MNFHILRSCRFDRIPTFIFHIYYFNDFFFVEHKNVSHFLQKSIIQILFKIKVNYSLCNAEDTKTLIVPIYYDI